MGVLEIGRIATLSTRGIRTIAHQLRGPRDSVADLKDMLRRAPELVVYGDVELERLADSLQIRHDAIFATDHRGHIWWGGRHLCKYLSRRTSERSVRADFHKYRVLDALQDACNGAAEEHKRFEILLPVLRVKDAAVLALPRLSRWRKMVSLLSCPPDAA